MWRVKNVMGAIHSMSQCRALINVPNQSWCTRLYIGSLKSLDHLANRSCGDSYVCIEVKARKDHAFRISQPQRRGLSCACRFNHSHSLRPRDSCRVVDTTVRDHNNIKFPLVSLTEKRVESRCNNACFVVSRDYDACRPTRGLSAIYRTAHLIGAFRSLDISKYAIKSNQRSRKQYRRYSC